MPARITQKIFILRASDKNARSSTDLRYKP